MKFNFSPFWCLLLTCIVVHTCIRIEVLNAQCGYYLPRTDMEAGQNNSWRVAAEAIVRLNQERMIALERQARFLKEHPDHEYRDTAEFMGPPYTKAEEKAIDAELREHRPHAALHDWVAGMGLLQYLLGPTALFWSRRIAYSQRSWRLRSLGFACAFLNLISVALMLYRGYFTSLGW